MVPRYIVLYLCECIVNWYAGMRDLFRPAVHNHTADPDRSYLAVTNLELSTAILAVVIGDHVRP